MTEQDRRSEFAQEFETAHEEFLRILKEETRTSHDGQDFVLVDNVTNRLRRRSPTCPFTYENDLDRLRQAAYLQHSLAPPPMRKHYFEEYLPVFYTLLVIGAPSHIHCFRETGLSTLPIALEALRRNIKPPRGLSDFHQRFYRHQFLWCPIVFDVNMGRTYGPDVISPFLLKQRIQPYREGGGTRENSASLYAIEVPEGLVGNELRKKMAGARIIRQGSNDTRYRFALKQFKRQKYEQFSNEAKMFANLWGTDGMVEYIGWFEGYEQDGTGAPENFCNIVLELADFDLYTAMRMESPPISSEEIAGFWESLAEIANTLASIHTVSIDSYEYLTWHGDVKPENILRVNDRFKLADPGEASMLLKSPNMSGSQRMQHIGGTRTYAAPEKAAYWEGRSSKKLSVNQTCDVWSLGCVLSLAATYVVLGTQGVLIFDTLRRQVNFRANEQMSDSFHDGKDLLPTVIQWHQYLREAARKTDPFTPGILDVVDSHMLVASETRWDAKMVRDELYGILARVKVLESQVPLELLSLIQNIDVAAEHHYDQRSGYTMVESEETKMKIRSIRLPSDETNFGFTSRTALLSHDIQPTSPVQTPCLSDGFTLTNHNLASTEAFSFDTANAGVVASNDQSPASYYTTKAAGPNIAKGASQSFLGGPEARGMKAVQVKQMLMKGGLLYKPNPKSLSSLFSKQRAAAKATHANGELQLLDQRLEEEFRNRHIVFLVDNGDSMATWWVQATELLEVLVWRILGYDEDGMELHFTDPDTRPSAIIDSAKARSSKNSVRKYTKAMEIAEPRALGLPACKTTIIPQLERIVNDYSMEKASRKIEVRKRTIIVLTDGLWEGMNTEYIVDVYLQSAFHGLMDLHRGGPSIEGNHLQTGQDIAKVRPVTIEFVQFGNDVKATERLRRLDEDLKLAGYP